MGQKLTRYATTEKAITLADSPYTASPNFNCIKVNTAGGNVRVNLPTVDYPIDVIKTSSDSYIVTVWVGGTQIGEVCGELSKITIENAEVTQDEPWYPYDAIVGIAGDEVLAKNKYGKVITRGVAGISDASVCQAVLSLGGEIVLADTINIGNTPLVIDVGNTWLRGNRPSDWSAINETIIFSGAVAIDVNPSALIHRHGIRMSDFAIYSSVVQGGTGIRLNNAHAAKIDSVGIFRCNKGISLFSSYGVTIKDYMTTANNYDVYLLAGSGYTHNTGITLSKLVLEDSKICSIYCESNSIYDGYFHDIFSEPVTTGATSMSVGVLNEALRVSKMDIAKDITISSNNVFIDKLSVDAAEACNIFLNGYDNRLTDSNMSMGKITVSGKRAVIRNCVWPSNLTITAIDVLSGGRGTLVDGCTWAYLSNMNPVIQINDNWCKIANCTFDHLMHPTGACVEVLSSCIIESTGCTFLDIASGVLFRGYGANSSIDALFNDSRYSNVRSLGSSTGTGSEQTIPHGLAAIPVGCKAWIKYLVGARYITEMIPFDATNVYPTVDNGVAYEWRIE